jgi:hypothetical protein
MKKSDVQTHTDNGYGAGYPAINVKAHHIGGRCATATDVMEKFGCSDAQAEKALEFAHTSACEQFWEYWCDTTGGLENGEYAYFPGYKVRVYSAGRSGGWLIVTGLPPVTTWDAIMLMRWAKFTKAVTEDAKYRLSKDAMLEDIEANEWYKEYAEQYNFYEGVDKKAVCIADVKADLVVYSTEKYGFVPALP